MKQNTPLVPQRLKSGKDSWEVLAMVTTSQFLVYVTPTRIAAAVLSLSECLLHLLYQLVCSGIVTPLI